MNFDSSLQKGLGAAGTVSDPFTGLPCLIPLPSAVRPSSLDQDRDGRAVLEPDGVSSKPDGSLGKLRGTDLSG